MKQLILVVRSVMLAMALPVRADEVPTMGQRELYERLGSADVVVIDVRAGRDWQSSDRKIVGAVRGDPSRVASWSEGYEKHKTVVLYCS